MSVTPKLRKLPAQVKYATSDLLGWAVLAADGIIYNKNGSLTAGWLYSGADGTASSLATKHQLNEQINQSLVSLGSEWMLQIDVVRTPATSYPAAAKNYFPDPATALIDDERRQAFARGKYFVSKHVLLATWLPSVFADSKLARLISNKKTAGVTSIDPMIAEFQLKIKDLEATLSSVLTLNRLCKQPATANDCFFDGLVDHCRRCLLPNVKHIRLPNDVPAAYLDHMIGGIDLQVGSKLLLLDQKYAAVIALDNFPNFTYPAMLTVLDQIPIDCRWHTRFICQDKQAALASLKSYRRLWQQKVRSLFDQLLNPVATDKSLVDQDAQNMVAQTEAAIAELNSGAMAFGYYTSVIVLMNDNHDRLDLELRYVRQLLTDYNFSSRIETHNSLEAFLGSLPGHAAHNIRKPLLSTRNLTHLLPLSSTYAGSNTAPCPFYPPNSPALIQAATSGSTPFRLNLHIGDVGHTLIFGPTGAGKSTLLAFLAAQFRRYKNATVMIFDKGCSMEVLTYAVRGSHFNLGGDDSLGFAPLSNLSNTQEVAWAIDYVESLVQLQQHDALTPTAKKEITRAVKALAEQTATATLTHLHIAVQDHNLKTCLEPYIISGKMGQLLDTDADAINLSSWCCVEVGELMERSDEVKLPVLTYLFHKLERHAAGQPYLLILDEAWLMLSHAVFRAKIREWLKTLRKKNVAVVLATQSLSDAKASGIMDVLAESCPTKIFLPNATARQSDQHQQYKELGLIDDEIDVIAGLKPKQDYYVKSTAGTRMINFDFGQSALSLIGASDPDTINQARSIYLEAGKDFLSAWLIHAI